MQKHGQPRVFVVNFEQIRNYEKKYIYIYVNIYMYMYIYIYHTWNKNEQKTDIHQAPKY